MLQVSRCEPLDLPMERQLLQLRGERVSLFGPLHIRSD
jgi:hypothetical protein